VSTEGDPRVLRASRSDRVASGWSRIRQLTRPRTRWRSWRHPDDPGAAPGAEPVPEPGGAAESEPPPEPGGTDPRGVPLEPAGFAEPGSQVDWRRHGRAGSFPEAWSMRIDLPIEAPARIGVVLHVHYPDLLPELLDRLEHVPVPYDLLVTNSSGARLEVPPEGGHRRNVRLLDVENRGRDILPLVDLANAGYLDPYHLVLKIHTKRSLWRGDHALGAAGDGGAWRDQLLGALLGSAAEVKAILGAFAERPDLGLVTADGSVLGAEEWGDNEEGVAELLRRLELDLDPAGLRFAAGSMYWIRGFALQGLRALGLAAEDFEPEAGQVNATTAHAVERALGILLAEAGLAVEERGVLAAPRAEEGWRRFADAPLASRARLLPFYLPQFHPIPENDRWWGRGFTEWTNVTAARPVYRGQYQPRLPQDLGFYDLRLDEVRVAQRDLAASVGIEGFMYYYYWFAGRRLLEAPIEALLKSDLDQPFCIMWANENWTRRWDGGASEVLIAQDYQHVPAEQFIDDVLPLLADERYLTIDGRKVVAIYRPGQVEDLPRVVAAWRERARAGGVGELFVMHVDVEQVFDGMQWSLQDAGLDGALGFPPHNHQRTVLSPWGLEVDPRFTGVLLSYGAMAEQAERELRAGPPDTYYPGVMVAFDNTPRRRWASDIWIGANPYTFRRWLSTAVRSVLARDPDHRVVFVNAWNEWAEGAVLEPSDKFGRSYLLAVRDVLYG
jgi:lipopolysaccharide biosynthesis protein